MFHNSPWVALHGIQLSQRNGYEGESTANAKFNTRKLLNSRHSRVSWAPLPAPFEFVGVCLGSPFRDASPLLILPLTTAARLRLEMRFSKRYNELRPADTAKNNQAMPGITH